MSAVYDLLSGRLRKALLITISVGTAALMFYFAYKSAQYDLALYARGRTSSALGIPMWVINLALPVGFTLAGIQYTLTTIRNLFSDDIYRSFRDKEEYSDIPPDNNGEHLCPAASRSKIKKTHNRLSGAKHADPIVCNYAGAAVAWVSDDGALSCGHTLYDVHGHDFFLVQTKP